MGTYLFGIGKEVEVIVNNEIVKMLIIGACVTDEDNYMHDYAGVPVPKGFTGKIYYFEHRELVARWLNGVKRNPE